MEGVSDDARTGIANVEDYRNVMIPTGRDVYQETKDRIRFLYENYDSVVCSFSGGKDSLVIINIAREVLDEIQRDTKAKLTRKVDVFFYDEELIPANVIDVVDRYGGSENKDRFNLFYLAVEMSSQYVFMGKSFDYIQWDNSRSWMREKPDYAVTDVGYDKPIDQHDMGQIVRGRFKGSLAIVNGIRADESLDRKQSTMSSSGEKGWILMSGGGDSSFCRPIYDWKEKDVFKYFLDNDIEYAKSYDDQVVSKTELRVATPLHAAAARNLHKLRVCDPLFYDQLCDIFPHVPAQVAYWKSYDRNSVINQYPASYTGILRFVADTYQGEQLKIAVAALKTIIQQKEKLRAEKVQQYHDVTHGLAMRAIFIHFMKGSFTRGFLPDRVPTSQDVEFEKESVYK